MGIVDTGIEEGRDAARIAGFMPYLTDALQKQQGAVITKAAGMQQNGTLTGEAAVALWAELLAARNLLRRFDQKTRAGVSRAKGVDIDF